MGLILASIVLSCLPARGLAAPPRTAPPTSGLAPGEAALRSPATARTALLRLRDEETIVFYGDSITEQNLYSAYLETFLVSRFPAKKLAAYNFGWSGDTASGGNQRFARDVAGVKPSLVFVNFGMNDGGYKAYDEPTCRSYLAAQQALADTIRNSGARQVLFTTSPIDDVLRGDRGVYNETLSRMAQGVIALGAERQLPVIDLLHPMLEIQRLAKQKEPGYTMIPDTVHPDPAGHLVMAYLAMRQIDAPRTVGEIVFEGGAIKEAKVAVVSNVTARDGCVEFDLAPPFLPFYVPKDARPTCESHCNEIGLSLNSVVIMANNVGCVCSPAPGAPGAGGAVSGGGMAALLMEEQQRESSRAARATPR